MKSVLIRTLAVAGVLVLASAAHAAFMTSYGTPIIDDPDNDNLDDVNNYHEITEVYFGQDAANYYFRIDVLTAPAGTQITYDEYAIYIDADNDNTTGADGTGQDYMPDAYFGIEYILDLHWLNAGGNWDADHFHTNTAGNLFDTNTTALTVQTSENGGRSIELAIPKTYLPLGPWTVYAATQQAQGGATSDTTVGVQVPEPATVALVGLGLAGLFARRRR